MTFKDLALKILKEYPDGIWVHFNDDNPDKSRMDSEIYLDADSLDDFEGLLKREVKDYYVDDFAYDELVVTLKRIEKCTNRKQIFQKKTLNYMQIMQSNMQRKLLK